jgi:hypothetical protein
LFYFFEKTYDFFREVSKMRNTLITIAGVGMLALFVFGALDYARIWVELAELRREATQKTTGAEVVTITPNQDKPHCDLGFDVTDETGHPTGRVVCFDRTDGHGHKIDFTEQERFAIVRLIYFSRRTMHTPRLAPEFPTSN